MTTKIDKYLLSLRSRRKVLSEKSLDKYLFQIQSESFLANRITKGKKLRKQYEAKLRQLKKDYAQCLRAQSFFHSKRCHDKYRQKIIDLEKYLRYNF